MSRSDGKSSASAIGLGIAALIAVVGVIYFNGNKTPKGDSSIGDEEQNDEEVARADSGAGDSNVANDMEQDDSSASTPSLPSKEDLERKKAEEETKQVSASYEDAVSQAVKRQRGSQWTQAAGKYGEAIDLLHRMPAAHQAKEMALLYNNRSAMLEKAGPEHFKKALDDIRVVLVMDAQHAKARARKARILEAQGKTQDALCDYTIHFLLEQSKGVQMPASQAKVEELSKAIAFSSAGKIIEKMRNNSTESDLPNKAYCRTFFELMPSTHDWKDKFANADIEELMKVYNDANDGNNLSQLMDVVKCAISSDAYHTAFKFLEKNASVLPADEENTRPLLALRARLQGMQKQLRRNLSGAMACYNDALNFDQDDIESQLLLAGCSLELGNGDEAQKKFAEILSGRSGEPGSALHTFLESSGQGIKVLGNDDDAAPTLDTMVAEICSTFTEKQRIDLSYCLFHRSSLWVVRNANHQFRKDVIALASQDISLALASLKGLGDAKTSTPVARKVYVLTLLKGIQLMGQTKGLAGEVQTQEDIALCKQHIQEANEIEPENPSVIMLNSDVLAMEDQFDQALQQIERLIKTGEDDGIPYVMKANMLTHQGMKFMQTGQMEQNQAMLMKTQECLVAAEKLYQHAMEVEPNCVEAMAQACQLKCISGDVDGALVFAEKAVPLARNAEELKELLLLKVQTSSQVAGIREIMKMQGQAN